MFHELTFLETEDIELRTAALELGAEALEAPF